MQRRRGVHARENVSSILTPGSRRFSARSSCTPSVSCNFRLDTTGASKVWVYFCGARAHAQMSSTAPFDSNCNGPRVSVWWARKCEFCAMSSRPGCCALMWMVLQVFGCEKSGLMSRCCVADVSSMCGTRCFAAPKRLSMSLSIVFSSRSTCKLFFH